MKIRSGFVSNSSSSSFIIIKPIDEEVEDADETIDKFLFESYEIKEHDEYTLDLKEKLKRRIESRNLTRFKLFYEGVEYGNESSITSILDKLEIDYLVED